MLTKTTLKDEIIKKHIFDNYELNVTTISFLPIGADFNTAVYRVTEFNGKEYFLKLRSGDFLEASTLVPKYLADLGVKQVIPPMKTKTEKLWTNFQSLKLKLNYQKISGSNLERRLKHFTHLTFQTQ